MALALACGDSTVDRPSGSPAAVGGASGTPAGATAGSGATSPELGPQPGVIIPSNPVAGTGVVSTGGTAAPADCGTLTQMADVKLGPVDIVWIIDGSASMVDELATIQQNLSSFANMIGSAGIDHHVMVLAPVDVADQTPLATDATHYKYVPSLVDSHNALQLLLDQYADYQAFLRPEAALHFIVVSDDESFLAAGEFKSQMETRAGKSFTFHAIASESNNGLGCVGACGIPLVCGAFAPGTQYYALADMTGGQKISICVSDWSMVFGPLQKAVIASAPLPCDYAIPAPPQGETLDVDKVNLEYVAPATPGRTFPRAPNLQACASQVAWFYDDPATPKQIRMCPAACDAISGGGGTLQIKLGCETVPLILN